MSNFFLSWLFSFWQILEESAPWLLLGFSVAGAIRGLELANIIKEFLSKPGLKSVLAASAIGVPLPLCSCSVIPVGVSLRRQGATPGATTSFFISTPQIGVDSLLLTWGLLGPLFAVWRILASFITALLAGVGVDWWHLHSSRGEEKTQDIEAHCEKCTAAQTSSKASEPFAWRNYWAKSWHFAFVVLVDDLLLTLFFGLAIAAAISALVPPAAFLSLGNSYVMTMLGVVLISVPMYICATSSTPIAAALVAKGLPLGAALVFLLAGPATNVSTIVALRRELGFGSVMIYLGAIFSCSLIFAGLLDALLGDGALEALGLLNGINGHQHSSGFSRFSAIVLVVVFLCSIRRRLKKA